jgi:hypothetical protein
MLPSGDRTRTGFPTTRFERGSMRRIARSVRTHSQPPPAVRFWAFGTRIGRLTGRPLGSSMRRSASSSHRTQTDPSPTASAPGPGSSFTA